MNMSGRDVGGADLEEGHHHGVPTFAYSDEAADTCTPPLSSLLSLLDPM